MILSLDILSKCNELFAKLWGLFVFPSFIVWNCICYHLTIDWLFQKILKKICVWQSHVRLFATPWTAAQDQASLSLPISQSLLKLMSIELVLPSNHFILCYSFLLMPSIFPSIKVFSSGSALCIRWPKYWSSNSSPSNEYSGLISFQIDWFDLLAVQETLKSLLQHHTLKASVLWK